MLVMDSVIGQFTRHACVVGHYASFARPDILAIGLIFSCKKGQLLRFLFKKTFNRWLFCFSNFAIVLINW